MLVPLLFVLSQRNIETYILVLDVLVVGRHLLVHVARGRGVSFGGELVDNGGAELAGGDAVLEEDIEFTVGTALRLGEAEVGPDETEETEAGPEETSLSAPVEFLGVEEVWLTGRQHRASLTLWDVP